MPEHGKTTKTGLLRYQVFAVICLSYILVYFHRLCPAVLALDMQESFQASGTLLGVLGSAYFYPYAAMQLPVGLLVDSWGPRRTVATFFLLAAAGSVLMGLAPNLGIAVLGRLLVGVGVSVTPAPGQIRLPTRIPASRNTTTKAAPPRIGTSGSLRAGRASAGATKGDLMVTASSLACTIRIVMLSFPPRSLAKATSRRVASSG